MGKLLMPEAAMKIAKIAGMSNEAQAIAWMGFDRDYYYTLAEELAKHCDDAVVRVAEAAARARMRSGR